MKQKLTPNLINKLPIKDKEYFVCDGDNLYLAIKPNGTKLWVFIYTSPTNNRRRKTSLKTYPLVSISLARNRAKEYQELIFKGIDPIDYIKAKKTKSVTFSVTLEEWLNLYKANVTINTLKTTKHRIEGTFYPYIKLIPINNIEHFTLVNLLFKKAKQHPHTANKILGYLRNIWQYAINKGYCPQKYVVFAEYL